MANAAEVVLQPDDSANSGQGRSRPRGTGSSAGADDRVAADARPVEDHALDADQRVVADRAAVQHGLVADRDAGTEREREPGVGVQHRAVRERRRGALRDALSIFDLMVTFSQGKGVTFQDALNNLHILDYEYYFKVVDGLLAQNATAPLLLFDEILHKGFDGQNFIVGLMEHIRNLMMTQDERTVKLLEVPDTIKKKYIQQAKASPYSLLLSWLNIGNQCDINYKMSRNQRLLVELALMKMAHVRSVVSAEPAAPAMRRRFATRVPRHAFLPPSRLLGGSPGPRRTCSSSSRSPASSPAVRWI